MENWLLIFFTITGSGGTSGTVANYIQFTSEVECKAAVQSMASIEQKGLNLSYTPKATCLKNGQPTLDMKNRPYK